jgi:hypothetical protein
MESGLGSLTIYNDIEKWITFLKIVLKIPGNSANAYMRHGQDNIVRILNKLINENCGDLIMIQ